MATKHDVIRLHQLRPEWSDAEIAAEIGCHDAYVRTTARRNGLVLPSRRTINKQLQERPMTTMNGHSSLTDAFAARRRELEAEIAALDRALAILTGIKAAPTEAMVDAVARAIHNKPRRRRKNGTYRDWIVRTARRPGIVTPDAVIAAAAERGRTLNRKSITVELSKMKTNGLLAKVRGGYQAAQSR